MNLRVCVHEAGHFYVAYLYRPRRAVSICIASQSHIDATTGEEYSSAGQAVSYVPDGGLPKVQVSIRAAGLAAESLIFGESFDALMGNATVRWLIKTDTDNAKRDLASAGLGISGDEQFLTYWRLGFGDAVLMLNDSQDKIRNIAEYCLANTGREILRPELVAACNL